MKNELAQFADINNLSYDASLAVLWGEYRSCPFIVKRIVNIWQNNSQYYYFSVPISTTTQSPEGAMDAFLNRLTENKKVIRAASYDGKILKLQINMFTKAKNLGNLKLLFDEISTFFNENKYISCCELCGNPVDTSVYNINDSVVCTCANCNNDTISIQGEQKVNKSSNSGNIITGLVGALLGSLIGIALWVFVFALGFIAALCGFILAITIIKGFELFGGKLNTLGIILTAILTIIMVFVSTYISYGYEIYDYYKGTYQIDFITGIKSVGESLKTVPEFANSFLYDLLLGYLFTIIGSVSTFIKSYKNNMPYRSIKL